MRVPPRPAPRYDPKLIRAIHASRAQGVAAADIASKHDLALPVVTELLRSSAESCSLLSPYDISRTAITERTAAQMYWLGYIAACGRLIGRSAQGTLILAIHPDDTDHISRLLADLTIGRSICEFAESSLSGRQAYIRHPGLARALLQWGIADTPENGSVPIEYVPESLVPDFVRGYIEGSRDTLPFGTRAKRVKGPNQLQRLELLGSRALMEDIAAHARREWGITKGKVTPAEPEGLARLTLERKDALLLLGQAYRRAHVSSGRAAAYVARFKRAERGLPLASADGRLPN